MNLQLYLFPVLLTDIDTLIIHTVKRLKVLVIRANGITQDSLYYNGTSGSQPRLEAKNQDNTAGVECVSLQRSNVTVVNGVASFSRSDWVTLKVSLQYYSNLYLAER
jgi:hypothetical protein